jgi:hypothetical protein
MTTDLLHMALAWAAMVGGVSCTSTTQPTPTPSLRPEIGAIPADLEGDYKVFAYNCSRCHDIERALNAPVTDNHHWELYVAKMRRTPGSGIEAREAPKILRFLFWYTDRKAGRIAAYVPEAPATPAAVAAPEPSPVLAPPAAAVAPQPTPASDLSQQTEGESTP